MHELRFYRIRGQAFFEVFLYEAPEQQTQPPRNSDAGHRARIELLSG